MSQNQSGKSIPFYKPKMGEKCHLRFNFGKNTQPLDIQDQKHSELH